MGKQRLSVGGGKSSESEIVRLNFRGPKKILPTNELYELDANLNHTWNDLLRNEFGVEGTPESGMFVCTETYVPSAPIEGEGWRAELDEQIRDFIKKFKFIKNGRYNVRLCHPSTFASWSKQYSVNFNKTTRTRAGKGLRKSGRKRVTSGAPPPKASLQLRQRMNPSASALKRSLRLRRGMTSGTPAPKRRSLRQRPTSGTQALKGSLPLRQRTRNKGQHLETAASPKPSSSRAPASRAQHHGFGTRRHSCSTCQPTAKSTRPPRQAKHSRLEKAGGSGAHENDPGSPQTVNVKDEVMLYEPEREDEGGDSQFGAGDENRARSADNGADAVGVNGTENTGNEEDSGDYDVCGLGTVQHMKLRANARIDLFSESFLESVQKEIRNLKQGNRWDDMVAKSPLGCYVLQELFG